jgi:hypothetical protein
MPGSKLAATPSRDGEQVATAQDATTIKPQETNPFSGE